MTKGLHLQSVSPNVYQSGPNCIFQRIECKHQIDYDYKTFDQRRCWYNNFDTHACIFIQFIFNYKEF